MQKIIALADKVLNGQDLTKEEAVYSFQHHPPLSWQGRVSIEKGRSIRYPPAAIMHFCFYEAAQVSRTGVHRHDLPSHDK